MSSCTFASTAQKARRRPCGQQPSGTRIPAPCRRCWTWSRPGALLGMSRSAVYRAAAAGHLPTLRFGRRVYIPTARLLTMLGLVVEEGQ
jgi:excisionase family DNA binding protein